MIINGGLIDGELSLHFAYQPVGAAAIEKCGPASVAAPLTDYQLDPLDMEIAPTGGTLTVLQTYGGTVFPGKVTIIVTPVKG